MPPGRKIKRHCFFRYRNRFYFLLEKIIKIRYNCVMLNNSNIEIRFVKFKDKEFWFSLDKHISADEFNKKVRDKQGYVLLTENKYVGILRYNLFWDNTPFCNLLYIDKPYQKHGYGKKLMMFWEKEMQALGYDWLLVSTKSDEEAQHFYRAIGYNCCGSLNVPNQAPELFLCKFLQLQNRLFTT